MFSAHFLTLVIGQVYLFHSIATIITDVTQETIKKEMTRLNDYLIVHINIELAHAMNI